MHGCPSGVEIRQVAERVVPYGTTRFSGALAGLEHFRPGKRNDGVHDAAGRTRIRQSLGSRAENDLSVRRVDRNSGVLISGYFQKRNLRTLRGLSVFIKTPAANRSAVATGDDPSFR